MYFEFIFKKLYLKPQNEIDSDRVKKPFFMSEIKLNDNSRLVAQLCCCMSLLWLILIDNIKDIMMINQVFLGMTEKYNIKILFLAVINRLHIIHFKKPFIYLLPIYFNESSAKFVY